MSDVIGIMEDAIEATGDIVTALKAAEDHGWRLVPVEPDSDMLESGEEQFGQYCDLDGVETGYATDAVRAIYRRTTEAAPRPWTAPSSMSELRDLVGSRPQNKDD